VPPALDLVPRERHACDSICYFRACTERIYSAKAAPGAAGGLDATEQHQVSFPSSGSLSDGIFHPVLCADGPFGCASRRASALGRICGWKQRQANAPLDISCSA